jgi:hypothetical protein
MAELRRFISNEIVGLLVADSDPLIRVIPAAD